MVGQWKMKWSTTNLAAFEVGGGVHLLIHRASLIALALGSVASPPAQGVRNLSY